MGIISGAICSNVPVSEEDACSDLTSNVPPVQKWGKLFVTSGTAGGDIIRIIAAEEDTQVTLTGSVSTGSGVIAKGGHDDFGE